MNQRTTRIETVHDLELNISKLYNNKPKGTDTETEGLSPYKGKLRLLQLSDDENTLVIDAKKVGYEAVAHYTRPIFEDDSCVKVFHNAKFDLKFINHYLKIEPKRIFDSYIASVLIEAGIRMPRGYHGLGQTLKRYTKIDINKDEQSSDWSGELSDNQWNYAAHDAQCLLPLRESMIENLRRLGLFRCANLEFEAIQPIAWLELCGFYLDYEQWKDVADTNAEKSLELADEINAELQHLVAQHSLFGPTGINLNSPKQVMEYFTQFGVPMPDSTKESALQPLADEYPIIAKFLEYKGLAKSTSSFGLEWKDFIEPETGRIHSNFQQIGASTGRVSCSQPNLQQIPHTKEFRNCFKAMPGNTLISADYSQIELRILADLSKDKGAIQAFESGADFHTAMAGLIFKIPIESVTPEQRLLAKTVNFAIPYGAGPTKIAASAHISMLEAQMLMQNYFKAVPNEKRWLDKQKRDVLKTHYARTASGRLARLIFDPQDDMQRSQAQRNATNMPIQGTSVDILKRALRLFYDATADIRDRIKLVNIVHDEINVEAPLEIADEVAEIMKTAMIVASGEFLQECPVKVDVHMSQMWEK